MFIDETIFPNAHAPQDAPAGTTADEKGAHETAPTLRRRYVDSVPSSMLTIAELMERAEPDHRMTSWGGVTTLEDADA
jgi:hypothetical protein